MQDSIFTKIINGDLPSFKIYEDQWTYAFLNINPIQPGHVLVVPREQVDHIEELEDEHYHALMRTVKMLMPHMRDELHVERVGIRVEGFEVPHTHVHLIPVNTSEDLVQQPYEADEGELLDMQERLSY